MNTTSATFKKVSQHSNIFIYQFTLGTKSDIIEAERKKEFNGKTYYFCQSSRFGSFYANSVNEIKQTIQTKFEA